MKIVFVCGSLEPGRDGVGDYVRRLAGELIRHGHQVAALALMDGHIITQITGTQNADGVDLPVLRLPSGLQGKQLFNCAKEWIAKQNPEWLSLQFVPFAFNKKGLFFGLSRLLKKLTEGRHWHIMVHELWVGMEIESASKMVWWGRLQRRLIQSLFAILNPDLIHTQTRLYQMQLAKLGFNAAFLPLFSNIAVINQPGVDKKISETATGIRKAISFVLFGTIHTGAPVENLSREVALYAQENGISVVLTIIGRCGKEQERWAKTWESAGLDVKLLGEQSPKCISGILENASIGIATTALALVDKSGSVAAMREHGIPILCVSKSWQPRGIQHLELAPDVLEYHSGNFEECIRNKTKLPLIHTVSTVSRQFADALSTAVK